MRTIFFLVIFSNIKICYSNYPYYHYKNKKVELTNERFNRYIRPQLRNILEEYYFLLRKMGRLEDGNLNLREKAFLLDQDWVQFENSCVQKNDKESCLKKLRSFYVKLRIFDVLLISTKSDSLKLIQPGSSSKLDTYLNYFDKLDYLFILNYKLLRQIEIFQIKFETNSSHISRESEYIRNTIREILLTCEFLLGSTLEGNLKNVFDLLWVKFIKKIEKNLIYGKNKKYLIENLGKLNLAWNAFHMKMVKSNIGINKSFVNLINIMHNRWNSILKILI